MEAMLIRERYKVVQTLWAQGDCAIVEAVDILEREMPSRLIDLYEGGLLHRYGLLCAKLDGRNCPAFREAFLFGGALAIVFDMERGESIDASFYRGDRWSWEDRLEFAGLVMHQALLLAGLPPDISCAVMLSDSLLVDPRKRQVRLRYMLRPMEGMTARELALLTGDQLRKILRWQSASGPAETRFLDALACGAFESVVQLYAAWRQAEADIRTERESFERLDLVQRGLRRLWRSIRRLAAKWGFGR